MKPFSHNDPITHLAVPQRQIPVLIDCGPRQSEGFVASIAWSEKPIRDVRRLSPSLVEGLPSLRRQKEIEKSYGPVSAIEWKRLRDLLMLKNRLNAGDWSPIISPDLNEALSPLARKLDQVSPEGWLIAEDETGRRTYRSVSGKVRFSFSFKVELEDLSSAALAGTASRQHASSVRLELPRKGESTTWRGTIRGRIKSAVFAFSEAFTAGLSKSRFVVWWHKASGKFVPGLYCPDIVTALYALAIWSTGTAGGWAICPRCEIDFVRKHPNQIYCKPQCQAAAGMMRLRRKRKGVLRQR
jgi:hypothetical protein